MTMISQVCSSEGDLQDDLVVRHRAYQLEMYREALQRNIIVAMDTGSGKTQIGVLRTLAALENAPRKIVWFLVPTVALVLQQGSVLQKALPKMYITKMLSGNDAVETWSSQAIWNAALLNVNVVVCTFAILHDALAHGFVRLSGISLLVFDEAHHASGKHPANAIMQDFYHVQKRNAASEYLPHIQGLTASPVMRNSPSTLQTIEQNLDSISKTPRTHREELMRHVNRPIMSAVLYQPNPFLFTQEILRLEACLESMDITQDPYVIHLAAIDSPLLTQTILKRNTYTQKAVQAFLRLSINVMLEVGIWASRYYMAKCVEKFVHARHDYLWLEGDEVEKEYIASLLKPLDFKPPLPADVAAENAVSPKVARLVDILVKEMTASTSGIVFVETRAQVHLMSVILAELPQTKDLIRSATFVGTSNNQKRKGKISDLMDPKNNISAVDDLRSGKKNLIICTSICEEGIDISACNLVICFQSPPTLKSFIQRRGRARAAESKFILLHQTDGKGDACLLQWQKLEMDMEQEYMNDMRKLEELKVLEMDDEGYRELVVGKTG